MKKKLFAILMVTLLAISLIGCSDSKKSEEKKQTEDIVGYDDEKIVITANKIEMDEAGGFTINFTAENKTESDKYTLFIDDAFLNDYYHVFVNDFELTLKGGKTKKDKIYIAPEQIAQYEIKDISKIDLLIQKTSKKTEFVLCSFLVNDVKENFEKPSEPKGQCYVDNDYCTIYVERVETENGLSLIFNTRNKTEDIIYVSQGINLVPPSQQGKGEGTVFDEQGNMTEYGLKTEIPGLDKIQGQYLIPNSVSTVTYNCIGQISITNFNPYSTEVIETMDMDLSTLYGHIIMGNVKDNAWEKISEDITITK